MQSVLECDRERSLEEQGEGGQRLNLSLMLALIARTDETSVLSAESSL